jgi:hypothetical protein
MSWEYLTSQDGMKFLAFIGGGIAIAGWAVWKVIQHFSKGVSAKNGSIAAGRDVNINAQNDKDSKSRK